MGEQKTGGFMAVFSTLFKTQEAVTPIRTDLPYSEEERKQRTVLFVVAAVIVLGLSGVLVYLLVKK